MNDPWAFGWTQLLASIGLAVSIVVSFLGLRTFGKWQREKVHERKLEVAFEALTLAYESGMVFDDIRRRLVRPYEWADMPTEGMSKEDIERAQTTYAIINRLSRHADFFDRILKVQPTWHGSTPGCQEKARRRGRASGRRDGAARVSPYHGALELRGNYPWSNRLPRQI